MEQYTPYQNKRDHDLTNSMTVIICKLRIQIKTARKLIAESEKVTDELQETIEEHIKINKGRKRVGDENKSE